MAAGPEAVVRGHRRAAPLVVDTMAARLGASASSRARLSRQCVNLGQSSDPALDIAGLSARSGEVASHRKSDSQVLDRGMINPHTAPSRPPAF